MNVGDPSNNGGFSLLELMIALVLVGVVATIAAPSFRVMYLDSHISTSTNDLVGHINRARSEAISRNVAVMLCRSTNVDTITPTDSTCGGGTDETWTTGWLIYTKPGYNGGVGSNYAKATDELLASHQGFDKVNVMSDNGRAKWLVIDSDGRVGTADDAKYGICDERSTAAGRLVEVSLSGRVSVSNTISADDSDCDP